MSITIYAPDGARVPVGLMNVRVDTYVTAIQRCELDGKTIGPIVEKGREGYGEKWHIYGVLAVPINTLGEHKLSIIGEDTYAGGPVSAQRTIVGVPSAGTTGYPFLELIEPTVPVVTPLTTLPRLVVHADDYRDYASAITSVDCIQPAGTAFPLEQPAKSSWPNDTVWQAANIPLTGPQVPRQGADALLRVRVSSKDGATRELQVPIKVKDQDAPQLSSVRVLPGNHLIGTPSGADATIEVLVTDDIVPGHATSGIDRVEYALDGGGWGTAGRQDGSEKWTAAVHISAYGTHVIKVRSFDRAGNCSTTAEQQVDVAIPADFPDIGRQAYFRDLLDFACLHLVTRESDHPTAELIGKLLCQPFPALCNPGNADQCRAPLPQLRAVTDTLARAIGFTWPRNPEFMAKLRDHPGIRGWLTCAYDALLHALGTSSEELRRSRGWSESERSAFANRMGFTLAPNDTPPDRPDRLDALLLSGNGLTEDKLAELFGFPRLASWPEAPPLPEPTVLTWRRESLRDGWRREDHPQPDPTTALVGAPPPVIDPDIVGEADISGTAPTAQKLRALRSTRVGKLQDELTSIRSVRLAAHPGAAPLTMFDETVRATLPTADLAKWGQDETEGRSIDALLAGAGLTRVAFIRLAGLRDVAASGPLTDGEWEEVDAILLRVRKLRLFDQWRSVESTSDIQLDPDGFVLRPDFVAVPIWRSLQSERSAWRSRLAGRTEQQHTVRTALEVAVSTADAASLGLLRDALLDLGAELRPGLHLDPKTSPLPLTTRLDLAIDTLHSVLLAARTKTLTTDPGPLQGWRLLAEEDPGAFDIEWEWMRSYDMWLAAMSVFLRPENVLLPSLIRYDKEGSTSALLARFCDTLTVSSIFHSLCVGLRDAENPDPAAAVSIYLDRLRKLPNLPDQVKGTWSYPIGGSASDRAAYSSRSELTGTKPSKLTAAPGWYLEVFLFVPLQVALTLQKTGQYLAALDWYALLVADGTSEFPFHGYGLDIGQPAVVRKLEWLLEGLDPHGFAAERPQSYLRFTLLCLAQCLSQYADAQFTEDTSVSRALARDLYQQALRVLSAAAFTDRPDGPRIPSNPLPGLLNGHAQLSLDKLRQGRNIAGLERPADPPPVEQLTVAAVDGLNARPVSRTVRPMPYRYQTLLQRARDLVNSTSQLEAAYLAALERRDAAAYDLLRAGQDLEVAGARVTAADAQAQIAEQEVDLSLLQTHRADIQRSTYDQWLNAGLNSYESDLLNSYLLQTGYRDQLAAVDAVAAVAGMAASASPLGWAAVVAGSVAAWARVGVSFALNAAELRAQQDTLYASKERREDEWRLQRQLAAQDLLIGQQQTAITRSRRDAASLEAQISRVQQQHASATLRFLASKFTGEELYEWMAGVLGQAYRYLLQQATAVAQMAQRQLYFERQEPVPDCIKTDYWTAPSDTNAGATGDSPAPNRRGLTGSARLLRDLTELDQHAFITNRRRLQISQAFSLAQRMPVELARFRDSGVLQFATPMELFDRAFPGQYDRLIRGVRLSIVGLIPPVPGVRATLTASGISRVVTGGDSFQTQTVRRDPEMIALCGAASGSGIFDLDPQAELLRPFENMGVDTSWELRVAPDANPFDFQGLADVVVTIDYTALYSEDYRQQVLRTLPATLVGEAAFQLSSDFPDQWYDLVNAPAAAAVVVRLPITRSYFPPNARTLSVRHVGLYALAPDDVDAPALQVTSLVLESPGQGPRRGGAATAVERIISTRNSSGASWLPLIGGASPSGPVGAWTLTLPGDATTRKLLSQLKDLILTVTFEATLPGSPP